MQGSWQRRPGRGRRAWTTLCVACAVAGGSCTGASQAPAGSEGEAAALTTTTVRTSTTVATTTLPTTTPPTDAPTNTTTSPPASTTAPPEQTSTTRPAWWREITAAAPLRLWVIGDSLGGPLGSALARLAAVSDLLTVTVDSEAGTGLVREDLYDWAAFVEENLGERNPDVIVSLLGANDGQALRVPGLWLEFGTAEWDREYTARVGAFMDLLAGGSHRVYWVGVPIMADPGYDQRVRHINQLQHAEATGRDSVVYVDAYLLFQDAGGHFARQLPGEDGEPVTVRLPDEIHLTTAGADRLAREVLSWLAGDWGLGAAAGD